MSHEVLSYIWFFLLTLVWSVYVVQESFITGGSILGHLYKNDEEKFKQINSILALHWDGIQVWLILAVGGLFAAFPDVYASNLSQLYIPFFLLLYAIIFRGISIEVIYKTNSKKLQTFLKWCLTISSAAIILVVGVYLINVFVGFPIGADGYNTTFFSFLSIFSMVSIAGGLLFVTNAIVQGASFIEMQTKNDYVPKFHKYSKWCALLSPLLVCVVFLSFSNVNDVFERGLFADYLVLWAFPGLSLLFVLIGSLAFWYKKFVIAFISNTLFMILFIFTGFISMVPYSIISTVDPKYGTTIVNSAAGELTLLVMFYSVVIFVPIVLGYQLFKYIKFWGKV